MNVNKAKKHRLIAKVMTHLAIKGRVRQYEDYVDELEKLASIEAPSEGQPFSSPRNRAYKAATVLASMWNIPVDDTMLVNPVRPNKPRRHKVETPNWNDDDRRLREFYNSYAWKQLRYLVLKTFPHICMCCRSDKGPWHVDHIKPLRFNWSLRLEITNLQLLCADCNRGKGNWDDTDWRSTTGK